MSIKNGRTIYQYLVCRDKSIHVYCTFFLQKYTFAVVKRSVHGDPSDKNQPCNHYLNSMQDNLIRDLT